jgi:hypothetical protein
MQIKKILFFIFIVLFLGLSLFSSLGHNHELDDDHHPNCFACAISFSFLPLVVSKLNLIISYLLIGYIFFFIKRKPLQLSGFHKTSRAPPINS